MKEFPLWLNKKDNFVLDSSKLDFYLEKFSKTLFKNLIKFYENGSPLFPSIDVRVKFFTFVLILISILFLKSNFALFLSFTFALFLNLIFFRQFKRFLPFLFIALIFFLFISSFSLTNLVVDGEIIFTVFKTNTNSILDFKLPSTVGVTREGIFVVTRFFLRNFSMLLFTLLFISSTNINDFVSKICFPASVKIILTLMIKNIKKFLYFLENYIFSAISRTPRGMSYRENSLFSALSISKLYLHLKMAGEELHFVLKSRGWEKRPYPSPKIKFNFSQFLFFLLICSLMVIVLIFL